MRRVPGNFSGKILYSFGRLVYLYRTMSNGSTIRIHVIGLTGLRRDPKRTESRLGTLTLLLRR